MYLMLKDNPVIYFSLRDMDVRVISKRLLPYSLRGKIHKVDGTPLEMAIKMSKNIGAMKEWLSSRVISLSRDNAKKIYNMMSIEQSNSIETRVHICLKCHGISVTDSYWIKYDDTDKSWEQMNIRKNHFKEIVDISLEGKNPTITTDTICPELTTKGLFRKAWTRDNDTKELYLLKSDKHNSNINTKMEVLASYVLSCFRDINYVEYYGRARITAEGKLYVSKCKNFVGEDKSFVEARELMEYCKTSNIDFEKWALSAFGSDFANIAVIDYIIMNTDRHNENYGFMIDNNTGDITEMAPLFDHNLALVSDVFGIDASDTLSQMLNNGESIRSLMSRMVRYSDLKVDYDRLRYIERYFTGYMSVYRKVVDRIHEYEKMKTLT